MKDKDKQTAIDNLIIKMSGGSNPRSPDSVKKFTRESEKFLYRVDGDMPTPEDAEAWMNYIRRTRKSINYQNMGYWAIKRLYTVNKWDWPDSLETGPRSPEIYEQKAPVFPAENIASLISWARDKGTPQQTAMIAISTTWGLRREEMRRIVSDDIQHGTILVRTGKHGRARRHSIPDFLQPYIAGYNFEPRLSLPTLSDMFILVCYKAGIDRPDGTGWHGIRRTIAGTLENAGWAETKISNYLRWSISRRGMALRYAMSTREDREIDLEAYETLPWVKTWHP